MPRSPAGVYSLPNTGFPIPTPALTIISAEENSVRNDIAQALTDSLDRNGTGGMVAPFRIADGVQAAPGLAFLNEPGTGLYRESPGVMSVAVQGSKVMSFTSNTVTIPAGVTLNTQGSLTVNNINFNVGGSAPALGWYAPVPGILRSPNSVLVDGNLATSTQFFQTANNLSSAFGSSSIFDAVDTINIAGQIAGIAILNSRVGGANNWSIIRNTGTAGDANFDFITGTGLAFTLRHDKRAQFLGAVSLEPTFQLYLDGGGDTFIQEVVADHIRIVTGGVPSAHFFVGGFAVDPGGIIFLDGGANTYLREISADVIQFVAGSVERKRINAAGFTKMSDTGVYPGGAAATYHEMSTSNTLIAYITSTNVSPTGLQVAYTAASPNDTAHAFIDGTDSSATQRFALRSNGGLANPQANNVNTSDEKLKQYIQPLTGTDALELWKAHRDVEWCSFKFIDQTHGDPNFGYLAQDIEKCFANVAPWLVEDDAKGQKWVYSADLDNIGHAVLSAAQRRIEALEAALAKNGITIN